MFSVFFSRAFNFLKNKLRCCACIDDRAHESENSQRTYVRFALIIHHEHLFVKRFCKKIRVKKDNVI